MYKLYYNGSGQLLDVKPFLKQPDKFMVGVDYKETDGKGNAHTVNTWGAWYKKQGNAWYLGTEFKPYGITESRFTGSTKNIFNLFPGYAMKYDKDYVPTEDELVGADLIMDHIFEVWADGDKKLLTVILAWFRHILVYGKRTGLMLLLHSKLHGAGKSSIIEAMDKNVFGDNLCSKTASLKQLMDSSFTSPIMRKCLLTIEELPEHKFGRESSDTITDKLKSYITDPKQMGNEKYGAFGSFESCLNIIGLTNNDKCLHYSLALRRIIACSISNHRVGDSRYFAQLLKACNDYNTMKCWVHKYIIECKKYNKIDLDKVKSIKIDPSISFLDHWANTRLRKNILRKNVNSIIYYFAHLINQWKSETIDDTYKHMVGRHQPLQDYIDSCGNTYTGIYDNYKRYCEAHNLYCLAKDVNRFKIELENTLETYIVELFVDGVRKKSRPSKDSKLPPINPDGRKGYGSYLVFSEENLDTIDKIVNETLKIDRESVKNMGVDDFKANMHQEKAFEKDLEFYDEGHSGLDI